MIIQSSQISVLVFCTYFFTHFFFWVSCVSWILELQGIYDWLSDSRAKCFRHPNLGCSWHTCSWSDSFFSPPLHGLSEDKVSIGPKSSGWELHFPFLKRPFWWFHPPFSDPYDPAGMAQQILWSLHSQETADLIQTDLWSNWITSPVMVIYPFIAWNQLWMDSLGPTNLWYKWIISPDCFSTSPWRYHEARRDEVVKFGALSMSTHCKISHAVL